MICHLKEKAICLLRVNPHGLRDFLLALGWAVGIPSSKQPTGTADGSCLVVAMTFYPASQASVQLLPHQLR